MKVLKGLAVLMLVLASVLIVNTHAQAGTYCWIASDGNAGIVEGVRLTTTDLGFGHYMLTGTVTIYNTATGASTIVTANGAMNVTGITTSTPNGVLEGMLNANGVAAASSTVASATSYTADVHLLLDPGSMNGTYFRSTTTHTSTASTADTRYDGVATLTTCLY
ncbi:hypothetical protein [Candidatus Magnetominusculus xianensis]|uniref:Secreted protein n=1 Tax=Candidatus Magnetominusculus xianensis TaxID=1748249 RepID=A0ABR5SML4_9BACT|nr:hypothetical protein [Candidatus Magnetominusculus xianensis]KWT92851.1 hypothetical protein ASN18_0437 [Candidatus Magnetominusculus xianensis]MBF0403440.1 hypothetical protein [Nitrospirota bacterium]